MTLIASARKEVGKHIFLAPLSAASISNETARAEVFYGDWERVAGECVAISRCGRAGELTA